MKESLLGLVAATLFCTASADAHPLAVRLIGTATGYSNSVQDIDGDGQEDPATCFDLNVESLRSGRVIGTASDCLSNVTPSGGGLALVGTTIFKLQGGTLTSRGLTTVQPTTHGSEDITHVTGAIPSGGGNDILSGDGVFQDATGSVRLSGAVNLSNLESLGQITFDCLFVINLDQDIDDLHQEDEGDDDEVIGSLVDKIDRIMQRLGLVP